MAKGWRKRMEEVVSGEKVEVSKSQCEVQLSSSSLRDQESFCLKTIQIQAHRAWSKIYGDAWTRLGASYKKKEAGII